MGGRAAHLGDPEDAADAVQNALVSAFRNAASYRGDAAVTTWLHRIVVNACLDLVRRRSVRPADPLPDDEARHPADPRDPIGARVTSLVVEEALATLPVEQRAALVLVDVQGYSVEEAAQILGLRARDGEEPLLAGPRPAAPPAGPPAEPGRGSARPNGADRGHEPHRSHHLDDSARQPTPGPTGTTVEGGQRG